ncbi:MAG: hypothetical protein QM730_10725 [Anaerolineales bacterium]
MYKTSHFIFTALLTACASLHQAKTLEDYRMATDIPTAPELTATVQAEIKTSTPPENCPVTTSAQSSSFTAPEPYSQNAPWEGYFWFGTKRLWTALPIDGVWQGLPDNPSGYTQKIMWWSDLYVLKEEPEPALVVSGRRLDAEAPPLPFHGATNAFAADIGDAMLTGVDFPTLGCWEITGQYKKSELKFVVWIAP